MISGVIFSILASISFALSNLLEKIAVDKIPAISPSRAVQMFRLLRNSRLWLGGFVLGGAAVVLATIAYSRTPITVVQSILGAGPIITVLASRLMLREAIGRKEWAGLIAILVAVLLVSLTLGSPNTPGTRESFGIVAIVDVATVFVAAAAYSILRGRSIDYSLPFGVSAGLLYGVAALQLKAASVPLTKHGLIGGLPQVFASPYPYIFMAASLVGLMVFQTGLQRSRVAVVAPITNTLASVYVVAIGMAVFDESLPASPAMTTLRLTGFSLVLLGGWFLSTNRVPSDATSASEMRTPISQSGKETRVTSRGEAPLVSVVITLFDGADFVAECIQSVLHQSYTHYEVIIADDESTDNSLEIVRTFDDARIRILRPMGRRLGLHANWARAYSAANGVYIKHVCHDDLLESSCLETQVAMLEKHRGAAIAAGRRRIIDDRGRTVIRARGMGPLVRAKNSQVIPGEVVARACVHAGTNLLGEPASVLVRRSMVPDPLFIPRWEYTIDIEFYLRMLANSSAVVDRGVVASFRLSASQLSSVIASSQARELRALFGDLRHRFPGAITRLDVVVGDCRAFAHAKVRRFLYRVLEHRGKTPNTRVATGTAMSETGKAPNRVLT